MKLENNTYNYHSIYIDSERCTGGMHCLKICPTNSIRVKKGKAVIISDRCIDCGECISACDYKAIVPRTTSFTDLSKFKYTIAMPSPALYGQFSRDILPARIHKGLQKLGFSEVANALDFCEAVSLAIGEFLKGYSGPKPLITAFCPTIIRLIQIKYPELVENILPIEAPREVAARELKKQRAKEKGLKENEIGIIYITPCPSKMIEIAEGHGHLKSSLDGAISIKDIYNPLLQAMSDVNDKTDREELAKMSSWGLSWAMLGGVGRPLKPENWLAVSGIHDVMRILSDIEDRKIREIELIECLSCVGGCVGGSLTVDNMYMARSKAIKLVKQASKKRNWNTKKIQKLYKENYFTMTAKIQPRPAPPLDRDIAKAIRKMKEKEDILSGLPKIDCGACGSPSCSVFAEDVVLGFSELTDCFAKREERARNKNKEAIKLV